LSPLNWEYQETVTRPIKVEERDDDLREITAIDLTNGFPFILDVPEETSMGNVEVGQTYRAKYKVYTSPPIILGDIPLFKFELVELT